MRRAGFCRAVRIADGLPGRKASCGCGAAGCEPTGPCHGNRNSGGRTRGLNPCATASSGDAARGCDDDSTRNGSGNANRSASPTASHGI